MKKVFVLAVCLLLMVSTAQAGTTVEKDDMKWTGTETHSGAVTFTSTVTVPTGGISAGEIADVVRYVNLPVQNFALETGSDGSTTGSAYTVPSASTAPGFESSLKIPALVWADNETSAVQVQFVVPTDYSSGGDFLVVASESSTSTANQIDFDVYINRDGAAGGADLAATDQTPAVLAGTSTTPDVVTLTVATDFASLAAGDIVTLRIWRDNTATGTNDLRIHLPRFRYTAAQ